MAVIMLRCLSGEPFSVKRSLCIPRRNGSRLGNGFRLAALEDTWNNGYIKQTVRCACSVCGIHPGPRRNGSILSFAPFQHIGGIIVCTQIPKVQTLTSFGSVLTLVATDEIDILTLARPYFERGLHIGAIEPVAARVCSLHWCPPGSVSEGADTVPLTITVVITCVARPILYATAWERSLSSEYRSS